MFAHIKTCILPNKSDCYIASAGTKCDWLIRGHVASD